MNMLSGIALIAAAIALLAASRRACQRCEGAWFTSDTFVLSVSGPCAILAFVGGGGMVLYSGSHVGSQQAAIVGLVFAAAISSFAAFEWMQSARKAGAAAHSAEIIPLGGRVSASPDQPTAPDAPRPPVTPRKAA